MKSLAQIPGKALSCYQLWFFIAFQNRPRNSSFSSSGHMEWVDEQKKKRWGRMSGEKGAKTDSNRLEEHNENSKISTSIFVCIILWTLPGSSVLKNPIANAGNLGSIPGSGRSPGGGNGNPLQDSCLEHPMNREAWWVTVRGIAKSQT